MLDIAILLGGLAVAIVVIAASIYGLLKGIDLASGGVDQEYDP